MKVLNTLLNVDELALSSLVQNVVLPFGLTFGVQLLVIGLAIRRLRLRRHGLAARFARLRRVEELSGLWILPLQLWCLQTALRTLAFTDSLATSHGPMSPEEGYLLLFRSLLALGLVLLIQVSAVLALSSRPGQLGLTPRHYCAFTYALVAVVLDILFLQGVLRWPVDY